MGLGDRPEKGGGGHRRARDSVQPALPTMGHSAPVISVAPAAAIPLGRKTGVLQGVPPVLHGSSAAV